MVVHPASRRVPRVPRYSGSRPIGDVLLTGVSPSSPGLPRPFGSRLFLFCRPATPKARRPPVWALPFSLAATWGISFDSFSSGYLDVSVHRVGSLSGAGTPAGGLPHSEIRGSSHACCSPRRFVACHVFLRRLTPRHPPYALCSLSFFRLKVHLLDVYASDRFPDPPLMILKCLEKPRFHYLSILVSMIFLSFRSSVQFSGCMRSPSGFPQN